MESVRSVAEVLRTSQQVEIRQQGEALSHQIKEREGRQAALGEAVKEQEAALERLLSLEEEHCPTCGTPLTPEHRREIEERYRAELARLAAEQQEMTHWLTERAAERLTVVANELVERAKASPKTELDAVAKAWSESKGLGAEDRLVAATTAAFARIPEGAVPPSIEGIGRIPRIGVSRELMEAAFALTEDEPVAPKPFKVEGQDALYVVRLARKVAPDEEARTRAREQIEMQLGSERGRVAFRTLVAHLKSEAQKSEAIEITPEFKEAVANEMQAIEGKGGGPRS